MAGVDVGGGLRYKVMSTGVDWRAQGRLEGTSVR